MEDIKNHFTGYLKAALIYERKAYFEKREKWSERVILEDTIEEKEGSSFEEQIFEYQEIMGRNGVNEWKSVMRDQSLIWRLERLKEKEQDIVFQRIFLEHSFNQIGKKWNMTEKQAQQAYYYAIRKMRRQEDEV